MSSTSMFSPSRRSSGPTDNSQMPSTSLYLFTFLATLLILFFVSCGIIARSYLARRRLDREVHTVFSVAGGGRTRSRLLRSRVKPRLFDAYLVPESTAKRWRDTLPVSVAIIAKSHQPPQQQPPATTNSSPAPGVSGVTPPQSHLTRFASIFNIHPSPVDLPSSPRETEIEGQKLQAAIIVCMPSRRHGTSCGFEVSRIQQDQRDRNAMIPHVVLGITRVNVNANPKAS